jgi:hypothetical protein
MSDGILTRRGGSFTLQTLAPTITKVSETGSTITFTLKNNDVETATLVYRVSSLTGDGESISVAADTTTSNIEITGLDRTSAITLFVTANVTGKVKSNVAEVFYDQLIYTAATGGTTLEYNLDGKRYKSHTFTSNGTFTVTTAGNGDRAEMDYLIIAGGGGGGNAGSGVGGGGGAGGFRTTFGTQGGLGTLDTKPTVTATSYGVTIGSGGSGGPSSTNGTNSSVAFTGTPTSTGGGNGGMFSPGSGGSGGGGRAGGSGGAGTVNQGFNGGSGGTGLGGGGGGAGVIGGNIVGVVSGNGGNGLNSLIRTGSNEIRGGGGTGAISQRNNSTGRTRGTPGLGGGGNSEGNGQTGFAGTVNTGGGGGGGGVDLNNVSYNGGAGGSGIVIIRYEIAPSL